MKQNQNVLNSLLDDINSPKEKLINILNKLEEICEYKKAEQLSKIIARLEAFQNHL